MIPQPDQLRHYAVQAAIYLRAKEANRLRGQPERLRDLEQQSDYQVLARAGWTATIIGAIACYFVVPLILGIMRPLLPGTLWQLSWIVAKLGMFLVVVALGAAAYFTFSTPTESE